LFLGALTALSVLVCGTAFADLVYVNDNGTLVQVVDSQGTTKELSMSGHDVHSFTHNGQPRLLVTTLEGDVMVFDPDNMSEPLASGTLDMPSDLTLFKVDSVAELGSNIVLALKDCHSLLIVNPETCELVNTYTEGESSYMSVVYPYAGQIVVVIDTPQQTSYQGENGTGYGAGAATIKIITMDSSGTITGTLDNFAFDGNLEASGGELYFALGDSDYIGSSEAAQYQGIYRVSGLLGNMDINNAVRVTSDNPHKMTRDGKGGLYYTAFGTDSSSSTPRYIYHWDGSTTSQVYVADSGYTIDNITYDIKNGVLYAEIISSSYNVNLTALTAGSDGRLTSANSFGYHRFTVMGNPVDSSSSSSGGNAVIDNPSDNASTSSDKTAQTTELPVGVIEPARPSEDVLQNIADLVSADIESIDKSQINYITWENISSPQEPTPAMRQQITDDGYEPAYKLNTLTVSDDGYYVFLVNIPEEFVGKSISDIRIYALKNTDITASIPGVVTGLLNFTEITNLAGIKIDTLEGQVLAVAVLQAGTPFSVYLTKILLMLLAGGCDAGLGIAGLCVFGLIVLKLRK